jgi:hypothetical protein
MEERRAYAKYMANRAKPYTAAMNWQRKVGPFGRLSSDLRHHLRRIENGGEGDGQEEIIGADVTPTPEAAAAEVQAEPEPVVAQPAQEKPVAAPAKKAVSRPKVPAKAAQGKK